VSRLHDRARRIQARLAVRSWEYRQRNHAKGVWFRLRRVLADAERAFVLSPDDASAIMGLGARPEPVGLELHPPRHFYFVTPEVLAELGSSREIPVRLNAALLDAAHVALLRFG
jgi:hypothetical protein